MLKLGSTTYRIQHSRDHERILLTVWRNGRLTEHKIHHLSRAKDGGRFLLPCRADVLCQRIYRPARQLPPRQLIYIKCVYTCKTTITNYIVKDQCRFRTDHVTPANKPLCEPVLLHK